MGLTPTQRTIRELRNQGRVCGIVERWNQHVGPHGIRQDLFGIIDVIALDPQRGVVGVQSCGSSFAAHARKLLDERTQECIDWLSTPGTVLERNRVGSFPRRPFAWGRHAEFHRRTTRGTYGVVTNADYDDGRAFREALDGRLDLDRQRGGRYRQRVRERHDERRLIGRDLAAARFHARHLQRTVDALQPLVEVRVLVVRPPGRAGVAGVFDFDLDLGLHTVHDARDLDLLHLLRAGLRGGLRSDLHGEFQQEW